MGRTKVHAIEVVKDAELRKKEAKARAVVKRFFPSRQPPPQDQRGARQ